MPPIAAIASASLPVRSRARSGSQPKRFADAPATPCDLQAARVARARDLAARDKAAAETLQRLLEALEAPAIDEAARARLAKMLDRHGAQHVTLLIRTIIESEGNANALVEPVIGAVSSVMIFHPEWADRGLAWIEAFDDIPLAALLQTMRDLDLFQPTSLGHYLFMVLRNRLAKVFEPPRIEKPPRKVYTYKRPKVTASTIHKMRSATTSWRTRAKSRPRI
jgi:hypothetical protein